MYPTMYFYPDHTSLSSIALILTPTCFCKSSSFLPNLLQFGGSLGVGLQRDYTHAHMPLDYITVNTPYHFPAELVFL